MCIDKNKELKNHIKDLENFCIEKVEEHQNSIRIFGRLKNLKQVCPKCGKDVIKVNDYYNQIIRDINMLQKEKEIYIYLKKRRYRCNCGKVFYEKNNFLKSRCYVTERFYREIKNQFKNANPSYNSIGKKYKIDPRKVKKIANEKE